MNGAVRSGLKALFLVTLGLICLVLFYDFQLLDAKSEHQRAIEQIENEFTAREKRLQLLKEEIRLKTRELELEEQMRQKEGFLESPTHPIRIPLSFEWESKRMHEDNDEVQSKREAIRSMMRFAWRNYIEKARGMDELNAVHGYGEDNWGGFAMSFLESMDTLLIMDMKQEFLDAFSIIDCLNFNKEVEVSVFETTIRALGGLLSAYELTGIDILKEKAIQLGTLLAKAFDHNIGFPFNNLPLASGNTALVNDFTFALSQIGTIQLEFSELSHLTNDSSYRDMADGVIRILDKQVDRPSKGLFSVKILVLPETERNEYEQFGEVSFGSEGDSFYEYLLKRWLQGGKQNAMLRRMYDDAIDDLIDEQLFRVRLINPKNPSDVRHLTLVGVTNHYISGVARNHQHLACFLPATLALGAEGPNKQLHMNLARALLDSCIAFYKASPIGLPMDGVTFSRDGCEADCNAEVKNKKNFGPPIDWFKEPKWVIQEFKTMISPIDPGFYLRPETIESLFVLYRITKDDYFRKLGWDIYLALEKYTKAPFGYSCIEDISEKPRKLSGRMDTYFLAETVKYLYLLFCPDDHISLKHFVLNTEAHPLRIRKEKPSSSTVMNKLKPSATHTVKKSKPQTELKAKSKSKTKKNAKELGGTEV
eukprot:TRINITY_DN6131_c0_g1_i1.p1 TRINITY_DN6131_c0_g1~~TRINITY_DN6131_c0_g1_i1.p1  ORF type:complete len:649 (-),score=151.37 TRINITY_DN6131_c0_g1_i1:33-1979(-)